MMQREIIAYILIGLAVAVVAPMALVGWRRRRRLKMRRRGIKRYGH